MATEIATITIESFKSIMQAFQYEVMGYNIGVDNVVATVKVPAKELGPDQRNILDIQLRRIFASQGWTAVASEPKEDSIFYTVSHEL